MIFNERAGPMTDMLAAGFGDPAFFVRVAGEAVVEAGAVTGRLPGRVLGGGARPMPT